MELVGIIRVLRPHRLLVGVGAIVSIVIGLIIAGAITVFPPGLADGRPATAASLSRVQLDTPHPLVAEARVKGAETIAVRTRLFAFLMSMDEVRDGIAERAAVDPRDIAVAIAGSQTPLEVTPLADEAAAATATPDGQVVSIAADPQVPVISITATAADEAAASELAAAATDELVALVEELAPDADRQYMRADPIGAPSTHVEAGGLRYRPAVVGTVTIFILWCSMIVFASGFSRWWGRGGRRIGPDVLGDAQQS